VALESLFPGLQLCISQDFSNSDAPNDVRTSFQTTETPRLECDAQVTKLTEFNFVRTSQFCQDFHFDIRTSAGVS